MQEHLFTKDFLTCPTHHSNGSCAKIRTRSAQFKHLASQVHEPTLFSQRKPMTTPILAFVRPVEQDDFEAWKPLWIGYNAFYGREGETALPVEITTATWQRFFDPAEPVFALVAVSESKVVGLAHYLYHRSTTRLELTCYLQDLYTQERERGRGIGRLLIDAVYREAKAAGVKRVYWQTHEKNTAGRLLYEKVATHAGFIVYGRDV